MIFEFLACSFLIEFSLTFFLALSSNPVMRIVSNHRTIYQYICDIFHYNALCNFPKKNIFIIIRKCSKINFKLVINQAYKRFIFIFYVILTYFISAIESFKNFYRFFKGFIFNIRIYLFTFSCINYFFL